MIKPKLPRILLLTTGGTITMLSSPEGGFAPCEDASDLISRIPELRQIAEIDILPVANHDSSNLQPDLWPRLARTIYSKMRLYDGFVVTHGTDTLCYTASALALMIQELSKPIVLTGAQVPLEEIGSDGRINLINAFRVATMDLAETVIVFGSLLIRATRAKKTSVFDIQAFTSVNVVPLGNIGLTIHFSAPPRRRSRKKALLLPYLEPDVALASVYPGIKPHVIEYLARHHKGIVLQGYGAGNIPTEENSLADAIAAAVESGVPVVVATQCMFGSTEMELYQVGRVALDAGAIPAMDMTPETALVKLMWVLGQTKDMATIDSLMQKSFVNELHETD